MPSLKPRPGPLVRIRQRRYRGRQQAPLRTPPADEGFRANELAIGEANLRLIVEFELAAQSRSFDLILQEAPGFILT